MTLLKLEKCTGNLLNSSDRMVWVSITAKLLTSLKTLSRSTTNEAVPRKVIKADVFNLMNAK